MSGHVDGVGVVSRIDAAGENRVVEISVPQTLAKYVARKGSIALDGVSLTVNEVTGEIFSVNLIPHTLSATNFGALTPGSRVNIEVDIKAVYQHKIRGPCHDVDIEHGAHWRHTAQDGRTQSRKWPTPSARTPRRHGNGETAISPVTDIIDELKAGRMVVLVDEERSRERRRSADRGRVRDGRGDQLHGALWTRPDLPHAHRRALPAA